MIRRSLHGHLQRVAALVALTLGLSLVDTAQAQRGGTSNGSPPAQPVAPLRKSEAQLRAQVERTTDAQIAYLERLVNINSGTLNVAGVKAVGDVLRATLDSLGFTTQWQTLPPAMKRSGHLIAQRRGRAGAPRVLLIGHLDTVFEGVGQQFVHTDSTGRGAGTNDIKGGDVIIIYALKALAQAKTLDELNISVIFTGDEESPGEPMTETRASLIELAKQSDIALAFEGGNKSNATVARRGASEWVLTVTGQQAHSAGVFRVGYGAIFEAARILDEFRKQLSTEPDLTFNPGVIVGATDVEHDADKVSGTAAGKTNIISKRTIVQGDLRFLTEQQKESARARMREIVSHSLPGTSAEIVFADGYPGMSPTQGNARLLAIYDSSSRALGYGEVTGLPPGSRGAGDISFVGQYTDGLDGLGAIGRGSHSPDESVNLPSLRMQTERAALLLYRIAQQKSWTKNSSPVTVP